AAEDFYKPRQVFLMTPQGEAAERALAFLQTQEVAPEVETAPLADIRYVLQELRDIARSNDRDSARIHRGFLLLRPSFEQGKINAQSLVGRLDPKAVADAPQARRLIDDVERFLAELVLASDMIADAAAKIDAARIVPTPWLSFWRSFCAWFTSQSSVPSNAEV